MRACMDFAEAIGFNHPVACAAVFMAASLLMIWRLEALARHGLGGTILGTLITPYCSGLGNLVLVYLLLRDAGDSRQLLTNCLVNNITNLSLLLALPALYWGLELLPAAGRKSTRNSGPAKREMEQRIGRLSLVLTLLAAALFTGVLWLLMDDGSLDARDGLILVGLFLFWQGIQLIDVLKQNIRQSRKVSPFLWLDLLFLILCALVMYVSLDWLVTWISAQKSGFIQASNLGWLSGWLMVLPNAVLALYYGYRHRADVVYASQVGDGHICIPLCLGLFALFKPVALPPFFETSVLFLGSLTLAHLVMVLFAGGLPRWAGWPLALTYGIYLMLGLG